MSDTKSIIGGLLGAVMDYADGEAFLHQVEDYATAMIEQTRAESAARIAELEAELLEEARINGMGGEREARLMAMVEEIKQCSLDLMRLIDDQKRIIEGLMP